MGVIDSSPDELEVLGRRWRGWEWLRVCSSDASWYVAGRAMGIEANGVVFGDGE